MLSKPFRKYIESNTLNVLRQLQTYSKIEWQKRDIFNKNSVVLDWKLNSFCRLVRVKTYANLSLFPGNVLILFRISFLKNENVEEKDQNRNENWNWKKKSLILFQEASWDKNLLNTLKLKFNCRRFDFHNLKNF